MIGNTDTPLIQAAKKILDGMDESSFPSLNKLADKFYEKNKPLLGTLSSKIETHGGLILRFRGRGSVLLSNFDSKRMKENLLIPYKGANGRHMHTMEKQTYTLSGRLGHEETRLETTIIRTQDYSMEEREELCDCPELVTKKNGKPKVTFQRGDNFPYWFITKPGKKSD